MQLSRSWRVYLYTIPYTLCISIHVCRIASPSITIQPGVCFLTFSVDACIINADLSCNQTFTFNVLFSANATLLHRFISPFQPYRLSWCSFSVLQFRLHISGCPVLNKEYDAFFNVMDINKNIFLNSMCFSFVRLRLDSSHANANVLCNAAIRLFIM